MQVAFFYIDRFVSGRCLLLIRVWRKCMYGYFIDSGDVCYLNRYSAWNKQTDVAVCTKYSPRPVGDVGRLFSCVFIGFSISVWIQHYIGIGTFMINEHEDIAHELVSAFRERAK